MRILAMKGNNRRRQCRIGDDEGETGEGRPTGVRSSWCSASSALLAVFAYFQKPDRKLPSVITGQASVIDGDTISIAGTHIRLEGVDAPEWEQTCDDANGAAWPCGRQAARELGTLIKGVTLTCKTSDFDQYDRVLAACSIGGRHERECLARAPRLGSGLRPFRALQGG